MDSCRKAWTHLALRTASYKLPLWPVTGWGLFSFISKSFWSRWLHRSSPPTFLQVLKMTRLVEWKGHTLLLGLWMRVLIGGTLVETYVSFKAHSHTRSKKLFGNYSLSTDNGCFQKVGGTPKWMVKIMENAIKNWKFGGTPIFGNIHMFFFWISSSCRQFLGPRQSPARQSRSFT